MVVVTVGGGAELWHFVESEHTFLTVVVVRVGVIRVVVGGMLGFELDGGIEVLEGDGMERERLLLLLVV